MATKKMIIQVTFFNAMYDREEFKDIMAESREDAIAIVWNMAQFSKDVRIVDANSIHTNIVSYVSNK